MNYALGTPCFSSATISSTSCIYISIREGSWGYLTKFIENPQFTSYDVFLEGITDFHTLLAAKAIFKVDPFTMYLL